MVALKVLVQVFPPFTMTSLRVFVAGLVIGLFMYFKKEFRKPTKKEWFLAAGAALLGVLGHHSFLTIGLVHTTASNAAIIIALSPLATSLFAAMLINERLTLMKLVGITLGIFGVYLVVFQGTINVLSVSIGDLYVFGAMLTQALSYILIKKATDSIDPKELTAIMFFIGSILLFMLSFFIEPNGVSQINTSSIAIKYWLLFFGSGVLATGFGHLMYNATIHKVGASQTAIFLNMVPLFALIGSSVFLKEEISYIQIGGFLLIVTGVIIGVGGALIKKSIGTYLHKPA
ncbi:MAG: hypothetical protein APF76_16655 [Desulfitibacter sp. BRH_c19]|nr:MAG: hypothetical protein APF76_16655 [Desulfitibacter sp. BRH_c19]